MKNRMIATKAIKMTKNPPNSTMLLLYARVTKTFAPSTRFTTIARLRRYVISVGLHLIATAVDDGDAGRAQIRIVRRRVRP